MNAKTHPPSLALLMDKQIKGKRTPAPSTPSVEIRRRKLLLVIIVWAWMITVLVSTVFYFAVRNNQAGIDWLAGLLLGLGVLDWILVAHYFRMANKPIRSAEKGE